MEGLLERGGLSYFRALYFLPTITFLDVAVYLERTTSLRRGKTIMQLKEFFIHALREANTTAERGPQTSAFKTPAQVPAGGDMGDMGDPTAADPMMTQDIAKVSEGSFKFFADATDIFIKELGQGLPPEFDVSPMQMLAESLDRLAYTKYSQARPEERQDIKSQASSAAIDIWSEALKDIFEALAPEGQQPS